MNTYVITEEFYTDFRVMTGALTYQESIKKLNEFKRQFPNRKFDTRLHMPKYVIGYNYPKAN